MNIFHFPPFSKSMLAFLLFLVGVISSVNGILMFFDDRKLNKRLVSLFMLNLGAMLILDGFKLLGVLKIDNLKTIILTVQFFLGLLSIFFTWDYIYERNQKISERESKTPPDDHSK